jgi:hypothetical protein
MSEAVVYTSKLKLFFSARGALAVTFPHEFTN